MNEIKRAWNEEVREKKRAASGVHSKKGKNGYVGTMRTPVDLMTDPKERRAYEGTTPVRTTIIDPSNELISYDEFKRLSRQAKTLLLYKLRSKYSVKALAGAWDITDKTIYYYFRAYGVKRGSDAPETDEEAKLAAEASETKQESPGNVADIPAKEAPGEPEKARPQNECSFVLVGDFEAQSLSKKLNGLAFMLDDKLKYEVSIQVKELPR